MQAQPAASPEIALLADLNREYLRCVQFSDVKRFDEILADDFLCSRPDGTLVDRAKFLEQTARPAPFSNLQGHDVIIRVIGDVALIHARTTFTMNDGSLGASRYTDIWAKRDGKWLAVAAQVTRY
jgi:ketosteroid isomerase-like protein